MKKILLAPDKFRGSLTAKQVCDAMTEGIKMFDENIEVIALPMADGGEGTLPILLDYAKGSLKHLSVKNPLGELMDAYYGISIDGKTAFIETATASGLSLLTKPERNPLITNTFGTGELIQAALDAGVEKIILGLGGSATNDAGTGMAAALGYVFMDEMGNILNPSGENLSEIAFVDDSNIHPRIGKVSFEIACDVQNPLFGKNGAAYVYAPQKGANPDDIVILDNGLKHFAEVIKRQFKKDYALIPGAGAAGGLGFGTIVFLNGVLKEGVKLVMEQTNFDSYLEGVDLIITGEGKFDIQTLAGKLIKGITQKAQEKQIPVAVICGTLAVNPQQIRDLGIIYATSIINKPMNLNEALKYGYEGVKNASFQLVSLFYKN
jgi:glycerate 2-kinase